MTQDERRLLWIRHLRTLADEHKRNCNENCNISLTTIKDIALHFVTEMNEMDNAREAGVLIMNWPI